MSKNSTNIFREVQDFIRVLQEENPHLYNLSQQVRSKILTTDPTIIEEVKYGGIIFSVGKPFCGVFPYKEHVSLEFSEGAALLDCGKTLEGSGKHRRHIKLACDEDIAHKQVANFIELAFMACKNNSRNS
jgi:hypothetical protein